MYSPNRIGHYDLPLASDTRVCLDYDNSGLKLAQLRFYACATTVPDASDPGGDQTTTCF
jgi:hypothetical protein